MKRFIVICIVLALVCVGLAGCAGPLGDADRATGSEPDAGLNNDTVILQDEEGTVAEIGAGEWPDYEMAKNIPEFKECKVVSSVQANDVVMITIESIDTKAFDAYLQNIKAVFTQDALESSIEDLLTYVGTNADHITVSIYYAPMEGEAVINVGPSS